MRVRTRYTNQVEGWLAEGQSVTASEPRERVGDGVKHVFSGWYSSSGKLVSSSNELKLTVTGPLDIESRWENYYLATLSCIPAEACREETLWLKEGCTLNLSELGFERVVYAGDTRYIFETWGNDLGVPFSPDFYFEVKGPLRPAKLYRMEYRVRVEPGEGRAWVEEGEWVAAGSTATVRVESARFGLPVQMVLQGFSVEGPGRVEEVGDSWATVRVEGPVTVRVEWGKDYTLLYALVAAVLVGATLLLFTPAAKLVPLLRPSKTIAGKARGRARSAEEELRENQQALEKCERELAEAKEGLARLDELFSAGNIGAKAYECSKREYLKNIEELESKARFLREEITRLQAVLRKSRRPG